MEKLSTSIIRKFTTSRKIDITSQTSVKYSIAPRLCYGFKVDCQYVNSNIKFIGNVHCPNEMCSAKLCVHNKIFQSFSRTNYQWAHCTSISQVSSIALEEQTNAFFLKCDQSNYISKATQKLI